MKPLGRLISSIWLNGNSSVSYVLMYKRLNHSIKNLLVCTYFSQLNETFCKKHTIFHPFVHSLDGSASAKQNFVIFDYMSKSSARKTIDLGIRNFGWIQIWRYMSVKRLDWEFVQQFSVISNINPRNVLGVKCIVTNTFLKYFLLGMHCTRVLSQYRASLEFWTVQLWENCRYIRFHTEGPKIFSIQ